MSSKNKYFADDGWAIWVDGDDTSTVYINDWLDPHQTSYIDIAVRIRGMQDSKSLNIYIPFPIEQNEIRDISLELKNSKLSRAIFSSMCVIDYKKNACTSEIAYNGKTVDIVHISSLEYNSKPLADGTLICIPFDALRDCLDNNEAYFIFRVPHKSLDDIFKSRKKVGNLFKKFRVLITTPLISERYGYSVRINEARLLPNEINSIGAFHRQKLKKAMVSISIADGYELNDTGCYKIRRLEEELYKDFLPVGYKTDNVITYQWQQTRKEELKGQFNFYFNISRDSISPASMILYMIIIMLLNAFGSAIWDLIKTLVELLK